MRIYVCNVATQEGETTNFTVADHIAALERNAGRGLFRYVLANNSYPDTRGTPTEYVMPAPKNHDVWQRYEIHEADLTDPKYPWRHNSAKLHRAIMSIMAKHQSTGTATTQAS